MNRFHLFISFLAALALAASCTEASSPEGYRTIQDIVYAQPGAKPLKYDAYIPDGARNLPGIVIIHGGGWISNTEDMMGGLAREFVKDGKYVVFSIDYRWLGKGDGDEVANTMDQLIEDCFGAILHIRRHARKYGLDPDNIAVTGGSTGAHLAACMITLIERIGDEGFGAKPGVYQYQPTYKPRQMSLSRAREELARSIKAAAPSYGVFDAKNLLRFAPGFPLTCVVAIAPDNNIPPVAQRAVPQYILLGSLDRGVQREPIEAYVDHLHAAGQRAELVIVEGAEHAFFDWDPEQPAPEAFTQFGIPYAAEILRFFDETFYK